VSTVDYLTVFSDISCLSGFLVYFVFVSTLDQAGYSSVLECMLNVIVSFRLIVLCFSPVVDYILAVSVVNVVCLMVSAWQRWTTIR